MEARYPALAELASEYMAGGGAATDKDDRGTARRRGTLRAMPRASAMSADSDDDMAAGGGTAPAPSSSPRPASAPTPGGVASAVAAARAGAYSALARSSAALTAGTLAVPWVMRVRSAELAQHLSIVEQVRVRRIDWTELLDVAVGNHPLARATGNLFGGAAGTVVGPPDDVDNVRHVIEWFNLVCQWVSTQVLSVPEAALRAKVIEKLIKVAAKCAQYCNYSTLMAITLALQSPSVDRLKRTWARVAADKQATLADLVDLTSPFHNFRKLRAAMAEATSGVPFIGIYLSDLLINTEVPGTVAVSDLAPGSTDADGEEGARARHYRAVAAALTAVKLAPRSTLPDATVLVDLEPALTTLVNWQKFKTMTKVIKQFRTALEAPSYAVTGAWPLKEDVFWRILDVPNQVLDVHELEARSFQFEPSMRRSVVPPAPATTTVGAGDE
ncbi:hypothetical protein AMAG_12321 [Allomyces macrogynus ATCC 38327]|uniref:Ras-GEF domain-containing protein n=1 Tax=Allomyces macrogynus (strain ATCC 38327) TaxID=578462 RepID=A0A0L0SXL6_ALLM3|nr:hypothetical protein AMAG_12321 [Allomyces macrogynus ATCC 38327]|eukprot:KNE67252.1 hypothetical protein AMAG_12321 [Allomyces macrogynus ATCC 38327]